MNAKIEEIKQMLASDGPIDLKAEAVCLMYIGNHVKMAETVYSTSIVSAEYIDGTHLGNKEEAWEDLAESEIDIIHAKLQARIGKNNLKFSAVIKAEHEMLRAKIIRQIEIFQTELYKRELSTEIELSGKLLYADYEDEQFNPCYEKINEAGIPVVYDFTDRRYPIGWADISTEMLLAIYEEAEAFYHSVIREE
jgi:hypothetical protein